MSDLFIILIFAVVIVLVFAKGVYDNKKSKLEFINQCVSEYGNKNKKTYSADELAKIKEYYLATTDFSKGQVIDDITWNDLSLDDVFMQIDRTYSQPGAEVLYKMLRNTSDESKLADMEEFFEYFELNKEKRISSIGLLHSIGKLSEISFINYINKLDECEKLNFIKHLFCLIFGLVSVASIFINPPVGFILMIASLIYNITSYFKVKDKTRPYILTFYYVKRLIKYSEQLNKLEISVLCDEKKKIEDIVRCSKNLRKLTTIIVGGENFAGTFLDILLDYLRMYLHLDMLLFNCVLNEVRREKESYIYLWKIIGFIDASISVGDFRNSLSYYAKPEFNYDGYKARGLYHPLIAEPVDNDIDVKRCVLITGSNASGKSTFLKTVAINAILSQTINTALAKEYYGRNFDIATSMALSDSINNGESFYMAEIKALKRIIKKAEGSLPVLCCIDEVLKGTNTAERISASAAVLEYLSKAGIVCFAATHDLELSVLLSECYDNYHFSENIEDTEISFSYKIEDGPTNSRNAIKLLSVMGFDKDIVNAADFRCKNFLENKVWT